MDGDNKSMFCTLLFSLTYEGSCTYELTMGVTACPRLAQKQTRQKSQDGSGGGVSGSLSPSWETIGNWWL